MYTNDTHNIRYDINALRTLIDTSLTNTEIIVRFSQKIERTYRWRWISVVLYFFNHTRNNQRSHLENAQMKLDKNYNCRAQVIGSLIFNPIHENYKSIENLLYLQLFFVTECQSNACREQKISCWNFVKIF